MIHSIEELRRYAARAPSLPADQDRVEVRIYASILTTVLALLLCEPLFYLLSVPESLLARVSLLAIYTPKSIAIGFGVSLLLIVPHLMVLCFMPHRLRLQWPRRLAAMAGMGSGAMWLYLAWLAHPLDLGLVWFAYVVRALLSVSIALSYGFSVNAQQLREHATAGR